MQILCKEVEQYSAQKCEKKSLNPKTASSLVTGASPDLKAHLWTGSKICSPSSGQAVRLCYLCVLRRVMGVDKARNDNSEISWAISSETSLPWKPLSVATNLWQAFLEKHILASRKRYSTLNLSVLLQTIPVNEMHF